MKKLLLSIMMMAAWMGVSAMSFERAQEEALYLTDKMAYELNLNEQQYNDAYEINLDYFLRIDSPSDLYGSYYNYRLNDIRCILHDWQYNLFLAADYFLRPILWRAGGWHFPIYSYYNRGYFYYSRPSVWVSYRGGHSRYYYGGGFYAGRRPMWDGGFRGHDRGRVVPGRGGHYVAVPRSGAGRNNGGSRLSGNGYHVDLNGHRGGNGDGGRGSMNPSRDNGSGHSSSAGSGSGRGSGMSHGNSFDGSSSRSDFSRSSGSGTGSSTSRGYTMSPSRSGSQNYGGTRSTPSGTGVSSGSSRGSASRGNFSSGGSRGGSYSSGGTRGGGFSGSSRGGGSTGGSSRGGRR